MSEKSEKAHHSFPEADSPKRKEVQLILVIFYFLGVCFPKFFPRHFNKIHFLVSVRQLNMQKCEFQHMWKKSASDNQQITSEYFQVSMDSFFQGKSLKLAPNPIFFPGNFLGNHQQITAL